MQDYFIQPLDNGKAAPDCGYDRTINAASMVEALEDYLDEADFSEMEFRVEFMETGSVVYIRATKTPAGYAFYHHPGEMERTISTADKAEYLQAEARRLNELGGGARESDTEMAAAIAADLVKILYGEAAAERGRQRQRTYRANSACSRKFGIF